MDKYKSDKGSDGYSTDDQSKKRGPDEREMEESLLRSKRKIRSPTKVQNKHEDKLDMILNSIQEMKLDLKQEIHQIREDQRKYVQEIEKLKIGNEKLKKENREIREELREIKLSVEGMDKDRRKNNVVINGLKINTENTTTLKKEMEDFIEQKIGVTIQVEKIHKLGEKTCLVGMKNERDKEQVMKNKHKLKDNRDAAIYINDDMTKQEREIQRQLRNFEREERRKGRQVRKRYNRVTVEGEDWKWDNAEQKMIKIVSKN